MSLPLTHAGLSAPGISAALDLKFASTLSLTSSSGITPSFSRASTGTYFNSSGVLTSAAINTPRFDHTYNGTSWVSRGLLVEEQRTNVVTNSADFTSGSWANVDVARLTSAGIAPDGTNTAVKMYPTSSTIMTRIYRGAAYSCISVFAKAAEKSIVYFYDLTGVNVCWFNLSSGTIGTNNTGLTASMTNCSNGWFRCSLASSSSTFSFFQIGVSDSNGSLSSTASGTNGILIWGAQGESGSFPTSYIPTTSASSTRSADVCQITGSNFSSFWNASEGAVAVEFDRFAPIGSSVTPGYVYPRTFQFAGTSGNSIDYFGRHDTSPAKELITGTSSSVQQFAFEPTTSNNTALGIQKIALGFASNDAALSYQGASVLTDNTVVVPVVTSLAIGSLAGSSNYLNGHIARLRYFNKRLPNATLQKLST